MASARAPPIDAPIITPSLLSPLADGIDVAGPVESLPVDEVVEDAGTGAMRDQTQFAVSRT